MTDALRLDVALHRLCLTKSRTEAKAACEAGAVTLGGSPAKPSQSITAGQVVGLRYHNRYLEVRVRELPGKSTSRKAARELLEVLRDDRLDLR